MRKELVRLVENLKRTGSDIKSRASSHFKNARSRLTSSHSQERTIQEYPHTSTKELAQLLTQEAVPDWKLLVRNAIAHLNDVGLPSNRRYITRENIEYVTLLLKDDPREIRRNLTSDTADRLHLNLGYFGYDLRFYLVDLLAARVSKKKLDILHEERLKPISDNLTALVNEWVKLEKREISVSQHN